MLDTGPAFAADDADWRTSLRVGDVVLFRFPVAEDGQAPEPEPRPCLVLDLDTLVGRTVLYNCLRDDIAEQDQLRRGDSCPRPGGPCLCRPESSDAFRWSAPVTVSLDNPRFVVGPGGRSPIIGHLDALSSERMHKIRARIHALRDIAAERQSRRPKRRRTAIRGVDFVVESRAPRRRIQASDAQR